MKLLSADQVSGSTADGSEHYAQAHLLFGFEPRIVPDASSGAASGELPVRSKIAASMDLVDRIGQLASALSRLPRIASTSCYTAARGISPRLQEQLGIRHNDRQSADLTAGVRASAPKFYLHVQRGLTD